MWPPSLTTILGIMLLLSGLGLWQQLGRDWRRERSSGMPMTLGARVLTYGMYLGVAALCLVGLIVA